MVITAIGIGTRGDVQPYAELAKELIKRDNQVRIATYEDFKTMVEQSGAQYCHLDGDAAHLTQYLVTEFVKASDFMTGYEKLYKYTPAIVDQIADAVKGSDLVLYGTCALAARSASDLYGIPCCRVYYSPYDATDLYSLYTESENPLIIRAYYAVQEPGMNILTMKLFNKWRKKHGLKKWTLFDDYRKQNGKKVQTFYPVSPLLMPPDPKWGSHIHVTGYWYHPDEYGDFSPSEKLQSFLHEGEKPLFFGFGKAESEDMRELQRRCLQAVSELGVRTVFQGNCVSETDIANAGKNVFMLSENVPYGWLFPQIKAVVHHGGNSTNGLGLASGCPTLVIALAFDQWFYGRRVNQLGLGPKPFYVRKTIPDVFEIKGRIEDLLSGKYDANVISMADMLRSEDGCKTAADIIEKNFDFHT